MHYISLTYDHLQAQVLFFLQHSYCSSIGYKEMCNSSRWNPTKEQIDMLEGFYKAGITTPSAAEIQHMASKLRVYGDIEGKNVFYWFQNHKARQRQRQVRHTYGNYDPRFHLINHRKVLQNQTSSPMVLDPYPSPYTNGFCSSRGSTYYVPAAGPSFCPPYAHQHQNPKLLLPSRSTFIAKSDTNIVNPNKRPADNYSHGVDKYFNHKQKQTLMECSTSTSVDQTIDNAAKDHHHATLPLFPIHPTGILNSKDKEKYHSGFNNSLSTTISLCTTTTNSSTNRQEDNDANAAQSGNGRQLFDFFATH